MAVHGRDIADREDPQMIRSLENDVDNEVLEDAMFREAEPFEVKEVSSVLQRLSLSCKESESRFACEILSKIDNDSATVNSLGTFVRELNDVVRNCLKFVDKPLKSQQLKINCLRLEFL